MTNEQKIMFLEKQNSDQQMSIDDLKRQMAEINKFNSATMFVFKDLVFFDAQSKVGFFGKDPIRQPSVASDTLANLYTALRSIGLIT